MKNLHTAILTLALGIATTGSALAALPSGAGAGYFGGAEYSSNQGATVGPYPTYAQCDAALQAAINNAVNNFGWQVISVTPCHYKPPYVHVHKDVELMVQASGPRESGKAARFLLDQVTVLRDAYRIDDFDQALREMSGITDPNLDPDAGYASSR